MLVEDGATESKSAPAKKVSNTAKTKQMSGADRVAQVEALEKAGDALGDNPMLEDQKEHLTTEIENLRELKLDRNLGVEKAFNERESARLLSLEESRIQQELDKQKKELEELCKTMAAAVRALLQQLSNPDLEPEKQANLLKFQREHLHDFQCKAEAKLQKTDG